MQFFIVIIISTIYLYHFKNILIGLIQKLNENTCSSTGEKKPKYFSKNSGKIKVKKKAGRIRLLLSGNFKF